MFTPLGFFLRVPRSYVRTGAFSIGRGFSALFSGTFFFFVIWIFPSRVCTTFCVRRLATGASGFAALASAGAFLIRDYVENSNFLVFDKRARRGGLNKIINFGRSAADLRGLLVRINSEMIFSSLQLPRRLQRGGGACGVDKF